MGTKRPDLLPDSPPPAIPVDTHSHPHKQAPPPQQQNGHRDDLEGTAFKGKISRFEKLSNGTSSEIIDTTSSTASTTIVRVDRNGVMNGGANSTTDTINRTTTTTSRADREPIYDMLSELEATSTLRRPNQMARSFIEQARSMEEKPSRPPPVNLDPSSTGYYDRVAEYRSGGGGAVKVTVPTSNDLMRAYEGDDDIYGDAQFALYDNFHAKLDSSKNEPVFASFPVGIDDSIDDSGIQTDNGNPPDIYDNLENTRLNGFNAASATAVNEMSAAERLKVARVSVSAKLPDFASLDDAPTTVDYASRAGGDDRRDTRSPLKSSVRATSPTASDSTTGTMKSVKWLDNTDIDTATPPVKSAPPVTSFKMGNEVVDFDSGDTMTSATSASGGAVIVVNGSRSSTLDTRNRTAAAVSSGHSSNGVHEARSVTLTSSGAAPSPAPLPSAEDYLAADQPLYANDALVDSSPAVDLHARASADRELETREADKERHRLDDILNLCARYERQLDYELLPAERDPTIHGKNAVGGSLSKMKTNGSLTHEVSSRVDACMGLPSQCHTPSPGATPLMRPLGARRTSTTPGSPVSTPTSPAPVARYEDYNTLARSHGVSIPKPAQSCDEIRNKLVSLRNHRDVLTVSIQDLKSQISLIEQQQNEAINQEHRPKFELEQALLDGESKTTADHIQAKINDLQRKLVDITQSSNKQMNRIQAELDAARETLKFLENEQTEIHDDLGKPTGERSNELRRRLSSNTDRCEAKRRAIDDLEFQMLEIETLLEASKDSIELQLTVEVNHLKHPEKVVNHAIEQQKKEMKTEFKNELRKMELVRKQCIKDYQKGNTMLREIEGNITNSEELLSEKLKLENTYTVESLKKQEAIKMPTYSVAQRSASQSVTRNTASSLSSSPSVSRASLNSPATTRASTDSRTNNRSSDGSMTPSSMSEFNSQSINSTDELEKRLSSSEESPGRSEQEQLRAERKRNRELELKLEKEVEIRSELVEQAIVLRNKQNQLQSRPLTRFLPVKEMADFNLRQHIETSGHCLDTFPDNMVTMDATSCRGYLMKLGAKGLKSWNKRWFVFDRSKHALLYYVDRDERKSPKSTIYFQAIEQVFVEPSRKRISGSGSQKRKSKGGGVVESSSFIVKTTQRIYVLTAPTPQCMRLWIDVIFTGAEGNKDFD